MNKITLHARALKMLDDYEATEEGRQKLVVPLVKFCIQQTLSLAEEAVPEDEDMTLEECNNGFALKTRILLALSKLR